MRNRLFEISAIAVGVAIVVGIYFYRGSGAQEEPGPDLRPVAREETPVVPTPAPAAQTGSAPEMPGSEPHLPAVNPVELEQARSIWQSAVADIEAVEAELTVLDTRFDAKEAELAELEAQGMDPEALEEEMLIFLDGIVDEYDALETRLAEAEEVEAEAAERLAELGDDTQHPDLF